MKKERKSFTHEVNQKDETIDRQGNTITTLTTKLEETDKTVNELRMKEEETQLRTDERIKAMEKSHQDLIVQFQNKLRKQELRDITSHLEDFSVQLRDQLEASELAYRELKERVETEYITRHEHKSKIHK